MRAGASTIGDVLGSGRRFLVPPYQRAYAWTREEALALLADIRTAQDHAPHRRGDAAPYFLGCFVLVQAAGDAVEHLVDGHQRLTTLSILLAILRDLDDEEAGPLDRHIRLSAQGGAMQGVLNLRPLDTEFFQRLIQAPGGALTLTPDTPTENDAQSNMRDVALALRGALEATSLNERRWLADYVLRFCFVVEVTAPYPDQAFQIFSVLNKRGKDLTDADLLKAEVMEALPPDQRNFFAQIWERLEADLGVDAFLQLFSHLRMIHIPKRPKTAIALELRDALRPADAPRDFIEKELEPKGRAFRSLKNATLNLATKTQEANRLLHGLHRIRNKDWLPPAIAYFAGRRPAGEEALSFLKALDRMAYGLFIQGADENTRIARFRPVIEAVRDQQPWPEIQKRMALSAHEKKMARAVLGGPLFQKTQIRTAVLLRIDEHLSDNTAIYYDLDNLSVEHVLPQNPPPQSPWAELWPSAADRKKWTDRLGNLTLLSRERNQDARNFDFQRKLEEYFTKDGATPFVITSQLMLEKEWTPEVVARRHEKLLAAAIEIWDL